MPGRWPAQKFMDFLGGGFNPFCRKSGNFGFTWFHPPCEGYDMRSKTHDTPTSLAMFGINIYIYINIISQMGRASVPTCQSHSKPRIWKLITDPNITIQYPAGRSSPIPDLRIQIGMAAPSVHVQGTHTPDLLAHVVHEKDGTAIRIQGALGALQNGQHGEKP